VPETLLKKRKSQEKERADKAEQREAKKKVRKPRVVLIGYDDDIYPKSTSCGNVVVLLTIFRD
jgi:predicted Rossmann fold nucleotide-binding protein DprA/Smf involved in DNA uptake